MFESSPLAELSRSMPLVPAWVLSGAAVDLYFGDALYYPLPVTSLLSCSRGSTGYVQNADGTLTSFGNNVLRISSAYTVTNFVVQSQALATSWTQNSVTSTNNSATAPDGTTTATQISSSAAPDACRVSQNGRVPITGTGIIYTFSCYLKAGTTNGFISFDNGSGTSVVYAKATLSGAGSISAVVSVGSNTLVGSGIISVGSGWYRVFITVQSNDSSASIAVGTWDGTANQFNYPGTASNGLTVFAWGAQLEAASSAHDYVATTSTTPVQGQFGGGGLGLLVEQGATNLILQSQTLDNASWTKGNAAVTADQAIAPDGTVTADLLKENSATSSHITYQIVTKAASSLTYTASYYFKVAPGATRSIGINVTDTGLANGVFVVFLISTGAIIQSGTYGSGFTLGNSAITPLGNGWYRCWVVATTNTDTGVASLAALALSDGTATYLGDGSSGMYIWGAQLEQGSSATSYIPTTTGSVFRDYDVVSFTSVPESVLRGAAASSYAQAGPTGVASTVSGRYWGTNGAIGPGHHFQQGTGLAGLYNGTTSLYSTGSNSVYAGMVKTAGSWDATGRSVIGQGGSIATDANTMPDDGAGNYRLGQFNNGSGGFNGYFNRFALWRSRLSNATLTALVLP